MQQDENNLKNESSNKESIKLIAKLQNLPIEQKAYLFILFMAVLGAIAGGVSAEIEVRECISSEECLVVDTTQEKLYGIGMGAVAGIGAAVFSSLPALLKRFKF